MWRGRLLPRQSIAANGVRLVLLRIGVVLGAGGGALGRMVPDFLAYRGGPIGRGTQWISWVHIDDAVGMVMVATDNEGVSGAYNATAPEPVTMATFSASLARSLGRPNLLRTPGIVLLLKFGKGRNPVLKGQRVLPLRF